MVSSASAASTRPTRIRRRSCALRPREGRRSFLERWTDVPSTATRAVRSRDATGLGYRPDRPGAAYSGSPQVLLLREVAVRAVPGGYLAPGPFHVDQGLVRLRPDDQ